MKFETKIKIHFDEADPAGIAFAGGLFTKMHRCFEDFIAALNVDPEMFFLKPEVITPLRHVEAEYLRPLFPLKTYDVSISVLKLSESSFQLEFEVQKEGSTHAKLRSTHVTCDRTTFQKCPIPETLKQNLKRFVPEQ